MLPFYSSFTTPNGGLTPSDMTTTAQHALYATPGSSSPLVPGSRFAGSPSKVLIAAIAGFFVWRSLSYLPQLDIQVGNLDLNVYNTIGFLVMYTGVWGLIKVLANLYPLGIVTDYVNFL